jgi:Rps23 Pro-64 3,4-dihydroxylase Tpa1-like proline 4-hydroxylase
LTPETAESLTEIYAELGLISQAVNLSRSVLHDNPYSTVCARILADHHDRQREAEEALDMWRRIATMSDSNRHARARIREIHHQLRSKTHEPSLDPTSLPDDPQQLFNQIRERVRSGDYDVALLGARKLVTLAPEFGQAAGELLDQLESLARSGSPSSRSLRIVVEPLSDETYRESSKEKLEQLSQLAQTPLGRHQIVREELVKLSKEAGVGHDQRDRIEDELKAS